MTAALRAVYALSKFYGQAERAISIRKLKSLLIFYSEPIKHVVFMCPSKPLGVWEISSCGVLHAYMHSAFITTELRYPAVPLA